MIPLSFIWNTIENCLVIYEPSPKQLLVLTKLFQLFSLISSTWPTLRNISRKKSKKNSKEKTGIFLPNMRKCEQWRNTENTKQCYLNIWWILNAHFRDLVSGRDTNVFLWLIGFFSFLLLLYFDTEIFYELTSFKVNVFFLWGLVLGFLVDLWFAWD